MGSGIIAGRRKLTKKREIDNAEFESAYKNRDNLRIMNKVCSKYRATIPADEIERCKLISLWEAMKAYDPNGGKKFTSFLHTRIDWECKRKINEINRQKKRNGYEFQESLYILYKNKDTAEIKDILDKLPIKFQKVLDQRFFHRMTMEEIAKENGYSRETARRYIIQALDLVRKNA